MKIIDILNKLHLSGDLKILIWADGLKRGVERKRQAYLFFNRELLTTPDRPTAITYTAEQLNVSESYVYKAIELMETQVPDPSTIDIAIDPN